MPLSDQDVTSVMDWLGRSQPVGQQQLSLATATGGAPAGGPVTPGGGRVSPEGPSIAPGGTGPGVTAGGASPIMQAVRVADLVRRAAGLVPSSGGAAPGIGSQVGAFSEVGGPGAADFSATQPVIGDIMAAPSVAPTMAAGEMAFQDTLGAAGAAETPAMLGTEKAGGAGLGAGTAGLLTAATAAYGAATAKQDWQKAVHSLDSALALAGVATGGATTVVAGVIELAMAVANLFGAGEQHTKGSTIHLPGVSPEGVTTRTAGGTKTAYASYGEGVAAANAFMPGLSEVKSLEELATLMNANPQPGRFNVLGGQGDAHRSNRAQEGSPPFTAEDLKNPEFVNSIWVQSGMMGAPADRSDIADAIRSTISRLTPETATPPGEGAPSAPAFVPGPGMTAEGPAGALGFSEDVLQAA